MQRAAVEAELFARFVHMVEQIIIAKSAEHLLRRKPGDSLRAFIPERDAPIFVHKVDAFIQIVEQVFAIAEFVIHVVPFSCAGICAKVFILVIRFYAERCLQHSLQSYFYCSRFS
ncbi:hypothetical protein SDC9_167264 [bioreactor metagenome]|uniref:Uncharacterized protein n=1 Tax=bioreactor metagenome TaxID=1076179 RepID=A0A645G246_9ZZZZ